MNAYRGRRVMVIGGFGFIGSSLTPRLIDAGAAVTVVTPSRARHVDAALALQKRGGLVVECDLREITPLLLDRQEVVFNLAGHSGAVRSLQDPALDLDVNCRGSLALLEALRTANRGARVVFAGSRLEYGRAARQPVAEDQPLRPVSVHGLHKATAEGYLALYHELFEIPFTVARLTNPFGPGQPAERTAYGIVNRFIHLAVADQPLVIYGDGSQRRDYIYIDDAVEALLCLGVHDRSSGRPYNVGTGIGTRLVEMAERIVRISGGGRLEFRPWPADAELVETGDFIADVSRIRAELGWAAAVSIEEGLQRTITACRAHV